MKFPFSTYFTDLQHILLLFFLNAEAQLYTPLFFNMLDDLNILNLVWKTSYAMQFGHAFHAVFKVSSIIKNETENCTNQNSLNEMYAMT